MRNVAAPETEAPEGGAPKTDVSEPGAPEAGAPEADREGIEPGAIFLARNRQQRRVWAVRDGRVHFFVRPPGGGAFWSPGHPPQLAPTVELFLSEIAGRLAPGAGRRLTAPEGAQDAVAHAPTRPIPSHKNAYR